MSLLYELGAGLVLGFSLTIPPGPMNAFIAAETVRSWRRGVVAGLGAMSADALLAVVVYSLSASVDLHEYVRAVYAIGAAVLTYFGVRLLLPPTSAEPLGVVAHARTYSTALGLGLSNPFQILWWLTAGLAFAYAGGPELFLGLFGAILIWIVAFPLALHAGTHRSVRVAEAVRLVSGAALVAFAVYFVVLAV